MSSLYILLTRSTTSVSRVIHALTGDDYTHASIAWDDRLSSLCSFARRQPERVLPAGLIQENLSGGYYALHGNMPCMLLRLDVEDEVYERARRRCSEMLDHRMDYIYDIPGLIRCKLGLESDRLNHYFCSQFVAEVLEKSGAVQLPKASSLMRPQEFTDLPGLEVVYEGELWGLRNHARHGRVGRRIA